MIRIDNAVVREGAIVLTHLPFDHGQRVSVVIDAIAATSTPRRTIQEIRRLLNGSVSHMNEPFEPMIPVDSWESLR